MMGFQSTNKELKTLKDNLALCGENEFYQIYLGRFTQVGNNRFWVKLKHHPHVEVEVEWLEIERKYVCHGNIRMGN